MFIKTELERDSDKPSFDVILGILVDVSVFKDVYLHIAFVRHCVCDATPYSDSARIVPRFPVVCNARKSKGI